MSLHGSPDSASTLSGMSAYDSDFISHSLECVYTPPVSHKHASSETGGLNGNAAIEIEAKLADRMREYVQVSCADAAMYAHQLQSDIVRCRSFIEAISPSDPGHFHLRYFCRRDLHDMVCQLDQAKYRSAVPRSYAITNNTHIEYVSNEDQMDGRPKCEEYTMRTEQEGIGAASTVPPAAPKVEGTVNGIQHTNFRKLYERKRDVRSPTTSVLSNVLVTKLTDGENFTRTHYPKETGFSSLRMGETVQNVPSMHSGGSSVLESYRRPGKRNGAVDERPSTRDNSPGQGLREAARIDPDSYNLEQKFSRTALNVKIVEGTQGSGISSTIQQPNSKGYIADEVEAKIRNAQDCKKHIPTSRTLESCLKCCEFIPASLEGCCWTCGSNPLDESLLNRSSSETRFILPTGHEDSVAQNLHKFQDGVDSDASSISRCSSIDGHSTTTGNMVNKPDAQDDGADAELTISVALGILGLSRYRSINPKMLIEQVIELVENKPEHYLGFQECFKFIWRHQSKKGIWETVLIEDEQPELQPKAEFQATPPEIEKHDESGWETNVSDPEKPSLKKEQSPTKAVTTHDLKMAFCSLIQAGMAEDLCKEFSDENPESGMVYSKMSQVLHKLMDNENLMGNVIRMVESNGNEYHDENRKTGNEESPVENEEAESLGTIRDHGSINGSSKGLAGENTSNWKCASFVSDNSLQDLESSHSTAADDEDETSTDGDETSIDKDEASTDEDEASADEDETSTTATRIPVAETYTVTYCAIIKSGNEELQLPINTKDVSGPMKTVIDNDMKKVWKWVQGNKLSKNISLWDAFDLAKDLHDRVNEDDGGDVNTTPGGSYLHICLICDQWVSDCSCPKHR